MCYTLKLRVGEPPGSLYNDIQRVGPLANLFCQSHTVTWRWPVAVRLTQDQTYKHPMLTTYMYQYTLYTHTRTWGYSCVCSCGPLV